MIPGLASLALSEKFFGTAKKWRRPNRNGALQPKTKGLLPRLYNFFREAFFSGDQAGEVDAGGQILRFQLCNVLSCFTVAILQDFDFLSVDVEQRSVVNALAFEAFPVIEAGLRIVGVIAHVPLAEEGGFKACFLQVCGEVGEAAGIGGLIVDDGVLMCVESG